MMREILELLLIASLSGSVLGILLLLLQRLLGKRVQPAFRYYLWILVAVRLLLPLEAPVAIGRLPLGEPVTPAATTPADDNTAAPDPADHPAPAPAGEIPPELSSAADSTRPGNQLPLWELEPVTLLAVLWLAVAAIRFLYSVVGSLRFTRAVRSAAGNRTIPPRIGQLAKEASMQTGLSRTPGVYMTEGIGVPLQIGLCRPVVLLPAHAAGYGDAVIRHILLHEFVHVRRRDVLYKWLVQLFVCIHWFNPLVYLLRRRIAEDCELSCDAAVLQLLETNEHKAYGDMLLAAAAQARRGKLPAGSVMLSTGARTLKNRLAQIAGYGKRAKPLAAASAVMVAALLVCGFVAGPSRGSAADIGDTTSAGGGNPAAEHPSEAPQIPYRSPVQEALGLNDPKDIAREFEQYKAFGLTHNLEYNRLYFNGELVRYFEDTENATDYKRWAMPDGTVDVYAVRDADWTLTGLRRATQTEFDANTGRINDYPHAYTHSVYGGDSSSRPSSKQQEQPDRLPGETDSAYYGRIYGELYGSSEAPDSLKETLAKTYEEYRPYGLVYKPGENRLYHDGRLVRFFSDLPDGGTGTSNNRYFGPYEDGEVTVTAQRDEDGELTGLEVKAAEDGDGAGTDWRSWMPPWLT